jgi:hypothetical protein
MKIEAVANSLMECLERLVCRVNVYNFLGRHESLFMINGGINYSITNGLGYNKFSIFFAIELQFEANVFQRNTRISETNSTNTRFDYIVAQSGLD